MRLIELLSSDVRIQNRFIGKYTLIGPTFFFFLGPLTIQETGLQSISHLVTFLLSTECVHNTVNGTKYSIWPTTVPAYDLLKKQD